MTTCEWMKIGCTGTTGDPENTHKVYICGAIQALHLAVLTGWAACRWFEVDQADVVAAKQALLSKVGAALSHHDNGQAKFPLKALSLHMLAADLVSPGWTQQLVREGLDTSVPTLWHAEGLLNYLTAEGIRTMLRDARQVRLQADIHLDSSYSVTCMLLRILVFVYA